MSLIRWGKLCNHFLLLLKICTVSWFWYANCRSDFYFDILITIIHHNVTHKKWFQCGESRVIFYVAFSFHRLAMSAACFLVVFHHFQICEICCYSTFIMTYIKEDIITNLQTLYSLPRNLWASNKSPALFLKKPLWMGDLLPMHKIFI